MKKTKLLVEYAKKIAEGNPDIEKIYLFPSADDREILLLYITEEAIPSFEIAPFYFEITDFDHQPRSMGLDNIRPEEFGKLRLPKHWGKWEDAELLLSVEKKYTINFTYTYDDLLDLHSILTGVDGYYIPNGSKAAKIHKELCDQVERLLEGTDNDRTTRLVNSNNRRDTETIT